MDIFPTLLAAAGVSPPTTHPVDGIGLSSLVTGARDESRAERFLMHYPHGPHRTNYWTSLRDGQWKVIYHYFPTDVSGGSHYQLFHLGNDPFEQTDLAASHPADLKRMMSLLVESLEQHRATYPVDKDKRPVKPKLPTGA